MAWHDASPWRGKRRRLERSTSAGRLEAIIRECRSGDCSVDGAIGAAYALGLRDGVQLERERISSAEQTTEEART